MKLGVDFGTNRIVVAAADRGNYPLVSFEAPDGTTPDWYPSLIALRGGGGSSENDDRRYGWDAWDAQADDSWIVIRSIKPFLEDSGPQTLLDLGEQPGNITGLLNGPASAVVPNLHEKSHLRIRSRRALPIVLRVH